MICFVNLFTYFISKCAYLLCTLLFVFSNSKLDVTFYMVMKDTEKCTLFKECTNVWGKPFTISIKDLSLKCNS